jgi:hypothetical protein
MRALWEPTNAPIGAWPQQVEVDMDSGPCADLVDQPSAGP